MPTQTINQTSTSDVLDVIRVARSRLAVTQGACSLNNSGLLSACIDGVMNELSLSPSDRTRLERELRTLHPVQH
ncbi:MAG: hypothetical protein CBC35_02580 [Planctomycetes bacterium TMED75]|nr:hypothetical protein [Planctomycetaceae bacterium]OUU95602.1 MAG: hypothetical protein CBC35_02580 [Planctomycetes bacterium TMED75]